MGSKWKLRWSNDVNQDKNDFDGSNPTAEMPKKSFSCGSHRTPFCIRKTKFYVIRVKFIDIKR